MLRACKEHKSTHKYRSDPMVVVIFREHHLYKTTDIYLSRPLFSVATRATLLPLAYPLVY
jgi:hypothetical protein